MRYLLALLLMSTPAFGQAASFQPDPTPDCAPEIVKGAQKKLNSDIEALVMKELNGEKELNPLQYETIKLSAEFGASALITYAAERYHCDMTLEYPPIVHEARRFYLR